MLTNSSQRSTTSTTRTSPPTSGNILISTSSIHGITATAKRSSNGNSPNHATNGGGSISSIQKRRAGQGSSLSSGRSQFPVLAVVFGFYLLLQVMVWMRAKDIIDRTFLEHHQLQQQHNAILGIPSSSSSQQQQQLQRNTDGKLIHNNKNKNLWDPSDKLPVWMKEYFAWHRIERQTLTPENWSQKRLLVLRCLNRDGACGGLSDRLRPIPFYLMLAAQTQRLFFIHWERPAPLQKFLVPPAGGMDWRIPNFINATTHFPARVMTSRLTTAMQHVNSTTPFVDIKLQDATGGADIFDAQLQPGEHKMQLLFRDCWNVLFEPAPPIQKLIDSYLKQLNLTPNHYVAAHSRTLYQKQWDQESLRGKAVKAIDCASTLRPGWPIFFASDSLNMTHIAVQYGQSLPPPAKIVARLDASEPLHLDKGTDFLSKRMDGPALSIHDPARYYDIFVDLYLLANSACVTYDVGGYGRWGSYLSFNRTCHLQHSLKSNPCQWTPGPAVVKTNQ